MTPLARTAAALLAAAAVALPGLGGCTAGGIRTAPPPKTPADLATQTRELEAAVRRLRSLPPKIFAPRLRT